MDNTIINKIRICVNCFSGQGHRHFPPAKKIRQNDEMPFTTVRREQNRICTSIAVKGLFSTLCKGSPARCEQASKRQVIFFSGLCHSDTELIEMPEIPLIKTFYHIYTVANT
jgi:hypothetical protein